MTENRRSGKGKRSWRKVRWALCGALLCGFFSYLYTRWLPDIYRSEAILRVVDLTRSVSDSASSGNGVNSQIPTLIWRDLLTEERLQDLGARKDLYPWMRSERTPRDLVIQMKRDIDVQPFGNEMVRVSCQSQDPQLALSFEESVVSALVERQDDDKGRILDSQIKETESRLQTLNKQISDLKLQVGGSPGKQTEASSTKMRQVIQKLQAKLDDIGRLEMEKANKERTLAERQREANWAGSRQDAASGELSGQIAGLNRQLEEARQERDGLRSRIAQYQNKTNLLSQYEKRHKQLVDESEVVRQQYQQLLATRTQLEGPEAQASLKGLILQVVVPPGRPDQPWRPNRPLLIFLGSLIGIVAGLGFSSLFKPRQGRWCGHEELTKVTGLEILARIPVINDKG